MNEFKVSGVILKVTKYGESDLIFNLLSDKGSVNSFFARGASKITSGKNALIKSGNFVDISASEGRNLHYPKEIVLNRECGFRFHSKSIRSMYFWSDLIKIVIVVSNSFASEEIYNLLKSTLIKAESDQNVIDQLYCLFLEEIYEILDHPITDNQYYLSQNKYKIKIEFLKKHLLGIIQKPISLKFSALDV